MAWDMLIRNATVFDGTGAPPAELDLGVQGDRIVFMGQASTQRARVDLDARGMVVCPGFIDIHTHSDMSLLIDGRGQSKVSQGVTTEVTGNCGFSPFPVNPAHLALHLDLLAGIGDDPAPLAWTDLEGYRANLRRSRRLGFDCTTCIHPMHVPIINEEYGVSAEAVARAQRMVAAFDEALAQGLGAVTFVSAIQIKSRALRRLQLAERTFGLQVFKRTARILLSFMGNSYRVAWLQRWLVASFRSQCIRSSLRRGHYMRMRGSVGYA
jgi:hypothetical protein